MATETSTQRTPTVASPLLSTFQKHIEDMRNLIICKICIKPLYEPYILACGHSYCYSCLSSWLGGANRRKPKNCPDCRAAVPIQPSPNYLLRDLVHMFISRAELLPEDETTDEHSEAKRVEALLIENDKGPGGGGLFKGAFGSFINFGEGLRTLDHLRARPIRDEEDGVDRCPNCAWELEHGMCMHCGFNEDGEESSNSDEDDDETRSLTTPSIITIPSSDLDADIDALDHDLEYDGDDHWPNMVPVTTQAVSQRRPFNNPWQSDEETTSTGYESSEGDNTAIPEEQSDVHTHYEDEEMSSFIDDDENEDNESDEDNSSTVHQHLHDNSSSVYHSDSDNEALIQQVYQSVLRAHARGPSFSSPESSNPEDEDEADSETETEIPRLRSPDPPAQQSRSRRPVRRPIVIDDSDDSDEDDHIRVRPQPGRLIIHDDDDDDDDDDENSEKSTPTPPQAASARRAHLESQRARRLTVRLPARMPRSMGRDR